jgi:hypothetical protein
VEEYDNILKSLYLLDYIDSLTLRQNMQRALNRGESYHKLHSINWASFLLGLQWGYFKYSRDFFNKQKVEYKSS